MNVSEVLYNFWSGFNLPAYDENTVPDNAELPYITYENGDDYFETVLARNASIWYRSPSWAEITAKEQQIAEYIGRGGRSLACDGGAIWIKRGIPWAQRMSEPSDRMVRRIVLNLEIEFIK